MIRRHMARLNGLVSLVFATGPQLAARQSTQARWRDETDRAGAAGSVEFHGFDSRPARSVLVSSHRHLAFVAWMNRFRRWQRWELKRHIVLCTVAQERVQVHRTIADGRASGVDVIEED